MSPCTGWPFTINPTPMPVPTVTYARLVAAGPAACPCVNSNSAGAFTSVSKPTGTPYFCSAVSTSVCTHFAFGVVVMYPYVGEAVPRSTGPNAATPSAAKGICASSQAAIAGSVSAGVVVGISVEVRVVNGVPTAESAALQDVPPSSMAARTVSAEVEGEVEVDRCWWRYRAKAATATVVAAPPDSSHGAGDWREAMWRMNLQTLRSEPPS
jgi:hypothetical protein